MLPRSPLRGTCPTGLAPRRPLRLDSDSWRALASLGAPRAAQAERPALCLAATRMRATRARLSELRLHTAPPTRSEPLGFSRPAGTSCHRRPGVPTEFSDSDRRGPRAQAPAPGRDKYFHSPKHLVTIPNGKPAQAATLTQPRSLTPIQSPKS